MNAFTLYKKYGINMFCFQVQLYQEISLNLWENVLYYWMDGYIQPSNLSSALTNNKSIIAWRSSNRRSNLSAFVQTNHEENSNNRKIPALLHHLKLGHPLSNSHLSLNSIFYLKRGHQKLRFNPFRQSSYSLTLFEIQKRKQINYPMVSLTNCWF